MNDENIKNVVDACLNVSKFGHFIISEIAQVCKTTKFKETELAELHGIVDNVRGHMKEVEATESKAVALKETTAKNIMTIMNHYTFVMDKMAVLKTLNQKSVDVVNNSKLTDVT